MNKKNFIIGKVLRNNSNNISKKNIDMDNNEKKLNIEIGTIELSWTNQDALTKNIMMNKKDNEYLLDHPPYQWKFFVEKNIEKILAEEANLVRPIRRSSKKNFYWKDFVTKINLIKKIAFIWNLYKFLNFILISILFFWIFVFYIFSRMETYYNIYLYK